MKRIFKPWLAAVLIVGFTAAGSVAQAQTREFLEQFNVIQLKVDGPEEAKGIEVTQLSAELLRSLTPKERQYDNGSLLRRIQMIYQIKFDLPQNELWYQTFYDATVVSGGSGLYKQQTRINNNDSTIWVYEAERRTRSSRPSEFLIFIKGKNKALICDIVGYITLDNVMTMLSPEIKAGNYNTSLEMLPEKPEMPQMPEKPAKPQMPQMPEMPEMP